jgi:hypothetical protein
MKVNLSSSWPVYEVNLYLVNYSTRRGLGAVLFLDQTPHSLLAIAINNGRVIQMANGNYQKALLLAISVFACILTG